MQIEAILKDIKEQKFAPLYFLMGDEPYFIDLITNELEKNVLTEEEKSFNQTIVYGKDIAIEDAMSAAKQFPMMSERTLVMVKEAQHLSRTIENLVSYAENPVPSTIFVISYKYKTLDKRKKLAKIVAKNGVLFESKKLYDNQIPDWIENYLRTKKISISPKAKFLLVEFLGTDLSRIANELDKLSILCPESITENDIEKKYRNQ